MLYVVSPYLAAFALGLAISAVPLAILELRMAAEMRERALRQPEPLLSKRQMRIRDKFIEQQLSITTFGDRRRRTAAVTELVRPETGPIETLSFALKDPYEEEQ
jgi:hypothetical protein